MPSKIKRFGKAKPYNGQSAAVKTRCIMLGEGFTALKNNVDAQTATAPQEMRDHMERMLEECQAYAFLVAMAGA